MQIATTRAAAVAPPETRLGPLGALSPLSPSVTDMSPREPYPPTSPHRHQTTGAMLAAMRIVASRTTTVVSLPGKWLSPPSPPSPLSPLGPLAMDASVSCRRRRRRPVPVTGTNRAPLIRASARPTTATGTAATRQSPHQLLLPRRLPRSLPPPGAEAAAAAAATDDEDGGDAMDDEDAGAPAAAPQPGPVHCSISIPKSKRRKGAPSPTLEDVRNAAGVGDAPAPAQP